MLQQYFDVGTSQVVSRIKKALNPLDLSPFVTSQGVEGSEQPDLWGPFWIYQTVIFASFFATSLTSFLLSFGSEYHQYNIETFAASATITALFTFGAPVIIWVLIQYLNLAPSFRCLHLVCLYGYANAVWVPTLILEGVLSPMLEGTTRLIVRWTIVGIGFVVSGKFLVWNLRAVIFNASETVDKNKATLVIIAGVLVHVAYAWTLGAI